MPVKGTIVDLDNGQLQLVKNFRSHISREFGILTHQDTAQFTLKYLIYLSR